MLQLPTGQHSSRSRLGDPSSLSCAKFVDAVSPPEELHNQLLEPAFSEKSRMFSKPNIWRVLPQALRNDSWQPIVADACLSTISLHYAECVRVTKVTMRHPKAVNAGGSLVTQGVKTMQRWLGE